MKPILSLPLNMLEPFVDLLNFRDILLNRTVEHSWTDSLKQVVKYWVEFYNRLPCYLLMYYIINYGMARRELLWFWEFGKVPKNVKNLAGRPAGRWTCDVTDHKKTGAAVCGTVIRILKYCIELDLVTLRISLVYPKFTYKAHNFINLEDFSKLILLSLLCLDMIKKRDSIKE